LLFHLSRLLRSLLVIHRLLIVTFVCLLRCSNLRLLFVCILICCYCVCSLCWLLIVYCCVRLLLPCCYVIDYVDDLLRSCWVLFVVVVVVVLGRARGYILHCVLPTRIHCWCRLFSSPLLFIRCCSTVVAFVVRWRCGLVWSTFAFSFVYVVYIHSVCCYCAAVIRFARVSWFCFAVLVLSCALRCHNVCGALRFLPLLRSLPVYPTAPRSCADFRVGWCYRCLVPDCVTVLADYSVTVATTPTVCSVLRVLLVTFVVCLLFGWLDTFTFWFLDYGFCVLRLVIVALLVTFAFTFVWSLRLRLLLPFVRCLFVRFDLFARLFTLLRLYRYSFRCRLLPSPLGLFAFTFASFSFTLFV